MSQPARLLSPLCGEEEGRGRRRKEEEEEEEGEAPQISG